MYRAANGRGVLPPSDVVRSHQSILSHLGAIERDLVDTETTSDERIMLLVSIGEMLCTWGLSHPLPDPDKGLRWWRIIVVLAWSCRRRGTMPESDNIFMDALKAWWLKSWELEIANA